jgi:hypothetical protein
MNKIVLLLTKGRDNTIKYGIGILCTQGRSVAEGRTVASVSG